MPEIIVMLEQAELDELKKHAAAWRRPLEDQAAVFIAEAMKLWNPKVTKETSEKPKAVRPKTTATLPHPLSSVQGN